MRWAAETKPSHLLQNKFYQLIRFVSMQLMHTMKVMMGVIFQGVDAGCRQR
jgi:hypothetical protein